MPRTIPDRGLRRRTLLRHLAVGAAGIAGGARRGAAGERSTSSPAAVASDPPAIRLERQSTGSEIWQVTTERFNQSNIYCEVPYCSRDGRYFIYERRKPDSSGPNRTELMAVEIGSWKQHRLDVTTGLVGSAISHDGVFYYLEQTADGERDLMRADLATGSSEAIHRMIGPQRGGSLGTVSADRRYYAQGLRLDDQYKTFGINLIDLTEGTERIIDRDPYILNPHPQFDPGDSRQLMIQHNRGGRYTPDGKLERLVGPEGATLYLLSVPDGKRTELQVGTPFTTPVTGHEAWIGTTREVLLTVSAGGDYAPDKGNLLGVRAGQPARVVTRGYQFNHVGVSRCGRFFCCDDWRGTTKLVIGSVRTGRSAVVCESKASRSRAQNTHPHAYLTPDLKWVIFNSDCSGFPHVHAASVPEGMIEKLAET